MRVTLETTPLADAMTQIMYETNGKTKGEGMLFKNTNSRVSLIDIIESPCVVLGQVTTEIKVKLTYLLRHLPNMFRYHGNPTSNL